MLICFASVIQERKQHTHVTTAKTNNKCSKSMASKPLTWFAKMTPHEREAYNKKRRGMRTKETTMRTKVRTCRKGEASKAAMTRQSSSSKSHEWAYQVGKQEVRREMELRLGVTSAKQTLDLKLNETHVKEMEALKETHVKEMKRVSTDTWLDASQSMKPEFFRDGYDSGYKAACKDFMSMGSAFTVKAKSALGYHPDAAKQILRRKQPVR